MEKSNLRLFSNIYPWKGRWKDGDQEFVAKIWDDKALSTLKVAARKKEVSLTNYQEELYRCTIQCPNLPDGERPWGWSESGAVSCRCRNERCGRFHECRAGEDGLSVREREIWSSGCRDQNNSFEATWRLNREYIESRRDTGEVDLIKVFGGDDYDSVDGIVNRPFDPNIASGYPDDEEFDN